MEFEFVVSCQKNNYQNFMDLQRYGSDIIRFQALQKFCLIAARATCLFFSLCWSDVVLEVSEFVEKKQSRQFDSAHVHKILYDYFLPPTTVIM